MTSRWEFPASRFTNGPGMEMEKVSPGLGLAAVASKETSRKKKFPRRSCRPGGGTGSPVSVTWVNVTGPNLMASFSSARAGVSCAGIPNTASTRAASTAMKRRHGDVFRTSVMNPPPETRDPGKPPGGTQSRVSIGAIPSARKAGLEILFLHHGKQPIKPGERGLTFGSRNGSLLSKTD